MNFEYSIVSSIDNEQNIKKSFSEYQLSKQRLINKISDYLLDDEFDESDLRHYLEKITENYDKKIYLNSVEKILKNENIVRINKNRIIKYLDFFCNNNTSDYDFVAKNNLETYINSLHVNNDRLHYYLNKLNNELEEEFVNKDDLSQNKIYVAIPQEIKGGEKNDNRSYFNIVIQTKS